MQEAVLRVGCPMWAHRGWVGRYFPSSTLVGDELAAYATWCTAVEGNTTFYALPDVATVARWSALAPPDFRFMFKLPQRITHELRLRNTATDLSAFLHRMTPLTNQMGPISIQLPASFGPADLATLEAFLDSLSTAFAWSVEVRHPQFFDGGDDMDALHDLLRRCDVDKIILDSRALFAGPVLTEAEREGFHRKPQLPVRPTVTAQRPIVRFIGQSDAAANKAFWVPWVDRVTTWLAGGLQPTVFIHTPDNATGPALARQFHAEVSASVPGLAPLPTPTMDPRLF